MRSALSEILRKESSIWTDTVDTAACTSQGDTGLRVGCALCNQLSANGLRKEVQGHGSLHPRVRPRGLSAPGFSLA